MNGGHVIVTGGVGAIGLAITAALLGRGHRVTVFDLPQDGPARLAAAGLNAAYAIVDVTDRSAVEAALAAAWPYDMIVGNAGIGDVARFVDTTPELMRRNHDVHVLGNFHLAQVAVRRWLAERARGRLIFVSSWIGERTWPGTVPYSVAKAGLNMLAKCIALEHGADGITANIVAPGVLAAGMAGRQADKDPDYARRLMPALPIQRLQTVDDVAGVVAFLCSPEGGYLTGSVITADGGLSLVTGGGW